VRRGTRHVRVRLRVRPPTLRSRLSESIRRIHRLGAGHLGSCRSRPSGSGGVVWIRQGKRCGRQGHQRDRIVLFACPDRPSRVGSHGPPLQRSSGLALLELAWALQLPTRRRQALLHLRRLLKPARYSPWGRLRGD